jgi:hypothetical protein
MIAIRIIVCIFVKAFFPYLDLETKKVVAIKPDEMATAAAIAPNAGIDNELDVGITEVSGVEDGKTLEGEVEVEVGVEIAVCEGFDEVSGV